MSLYENHEFYQHEQVSFFHDTASGLKAIIAIHNTALGSAAGGIRMRPYNSSHEALEDVLRLSRGMTYKSALAGLPLGGGKTVVIGDPNTEKTPELLQALGRAINGLGGQYTAGEDVGMGDEDMEIIATETNFVARGQAADTAPDTAIGVFNAMTVAVKHKLDRSDLKGLKVAIQGMGKVAYNLAKILVSHGARVYAADINADMLDKAASELGIETVSTEEVAFLDVDVFAPCALGGILNEHTIPKIIAPIVCGAANNQLATAEDDTRIKAQGILFLPDYAINSGGVIGGACRFTGQDDATREAMLNKIGETAQKIIDKSTTLNIGTQQAADLLAEEIIANSRGE